jgi:DNA-directed RNA polymerase subunit H (RpoH/RPB5)/uncharacterized protein YciU (UPF0263 family)
MNRSALKQYRPTGFLQYDIYKIVTECYCPYRGLTIKSAEVNKDDFIKNMQYDGYVKLETEADGKKILIFILDKNERGSNDIITTTESFKLFINSIKNKEAEIVIISPARFQTHVINYVYENGLNENMYRYHYDNFKVVVPLGPYVPEHKILNEQERKKVLNTLNIEPKNMKKIYTDDPQSIWLGARPEQILEIKSYSQTVGYTVDYRRVVHRDDLGQ